MSMYVDQNEEWSPDGDIRPGSGPLGVDSADDMAPDGVKERQRQLAAFMSQPDPFESQDLDEVTESQRYEAVQGHSGQPLLSRSHQECIEFYEQMEPSMRALLTRKTPETLQLLKWQAGLSKNKSSTLQIRMVAAKITFSVSVVAFTNVGEFRVFVLPSEAADIQMEMGAPLSYTYEGKTSDAVFVSCYRLDGFPYKFLQLGVDQEQEKG